MVRASIPVLRDGFLSRMSSTLIFHLRGVIGLARVGVRLDALLQNSPRGDRRGSSRLGIFGYHGSLRRRRRPRAIRRRPRACPQPLRPDELPTARQAGRCLLAATPRCPTATGQSLGRPPGASTVSLGPTGGGSAELVNQRGGDLKRGLYARRDRPASGRRPDGEGGGHRPEDVSPLPAPGALTDLAPMPATARKPPSRPRWPASESGWMGPISARTTAQPGGGRRAIGCGLI